MTLEEKSLIIAFTLGDGHIAPEGRLIINHCEKQKGYLLYKADIVNKIIGKKPVTIHKTKNIVKGKEYFGYTIRKCCKAKLQEIYDLVYPNKKKVISREVLDYLTPQGIAIWYMDDGTLYPDKKDGKIHAWKLRIATYLSKEENQVIVDYFKEKWDIQFHIYKDGNKYLIGMGTKEAKRFLTLVKPYIDEVECMKYKVRIFDTSAEHKESDDIV